MLCAIAVLVAALLGFAVGHYRYKLRIIRNLYKMADRLTPRERQLMTTLFRTARVRGVLRGE